jgi:hypothetical protein
MAIKWQENDQMARKWQENGKMERLVARRFKDLIQNAFPCFMLASPKTKPTPVWVLRRHQTPMPLLHAADRELSATDFWSAP